MDYEIETIKLANMNKKYLSEDEFNKLILNTVKARLLTNIYIFVYPNKYSYQYVDLIYQNFNTWAYRIYNKTDKISMDRQHIYVYFEKDNHPCFALYTQNINDKYKFMYWDGISHYSNINIDSKVNERLEAYLLINKI